MRTFLSRTGFLLLLMASGQGRAVDSLGQALLTQDWDQALTLAHTMSGPTIEKQALPLAQDGVVPAMWLMGQARFAQQDSQGASMWFYRGWLGLQMDLSLCRLTSARAITNVLMDSFPNALTSVRNDVTLRTQGIQEASRYYEGADHQDPFPGWSCRWAAKRWHTAPLMVSISQFTAQRSKALQTFLIQTGQAPLNAYTPLSSSRLQP